MSLLYALPLYFAGAAIDPLTEVTCAGEVLQTIALISEAATIDANGEVRMALWRLMAGLCLALAAENAAARPSGQVHWVESWGTAQQPAPSRLPPRPVVASNVPTSVAPVRAAPGPMVPYPKTFANQSVRMIVRTSIGGSAMRFAFSNASGGDPVTFGAVHAGLAGADHAIVPQSDRRVTFGGQPSVTIFPGGSVVSDPVALPVPALASVAVTIHLPVETAVNTVHDLGLNTTYVAEGNATAAARLDQPKLLRSYFWLTGLSVAAEQASRGVIIMLGDSITDGYATTPGAHKAWPDLLAEKLQRSPATRHLGVVNVGISGNRILRAGAGEAAVARFDQDVLGRPGARWVVLLEGINDINMSIIPSLPESQRVTAEQIIAGMQQIISRTHLHGLKIAGGTILPTKGLPFYSEAGEAMRDRVNQWIRNGGAFDAVIDFDAAVRDKDDPLRLRPAFDPGDHVHPNDAGNQAMADAIDIMAFVK